MPPLRKEILWRFGLVYAATLVFAVFIIGRIIYLQYIEGDIWRGKSSEQSTMDIIIPASRGDIYSSDGKVLASSVPFYEVRMDMKADGLTPEVFNANIDSLALCLSQLFKDKPSTTYKSELIKARKNGNRYFLIKRQVSYLELKAMKKFPLFRLGPYKGGFIAIQDNRRAKPFKYLASRTIGYITKDRTVVGLEGAYDHELRGVQGVKLMQKLAGNVWMPLNDGSEVEPKDGMDVVSTIDVNLQDVAENALLTQLTQRNAHHGCVIVMEVKTGYIRAIANLERKDDGSYIEKYNYAIGESTEPGSTFKLASLIVALEDGYLDITDSVNTGNGVVSYYGVNMKDSHEGGYGKVSVKEAFEYSSNVAISKLITKYYQDQPQRFVDRLYKMGLNQKLGLEIKGEGTPMIKDPGDSLWSGVSLPWMSIGYEVQLTPLQILAFYNAVANNGALMHPRFVEELRYRGETIKRFEPSILNPSICSKKTIKKVKTMLEGVVENGTARNLKGTNYKIAGKTGTAQVANKKYGYRHENAQKSYQASFVGYFPADNPKYSCIVVVNSPSNDVYYGNLVAGPIFKEIADKVYATSLDLQTPLNLLCLQKKNMPVSMNGYINDLTLIYNEFNVNVDTKELTSKWTITEKNENKVSLHNRIIQSNLVPNVVGMGLRDALFILENAGLQVSIIGKGSVKQQSIQPGEKITSNQRIIIHLS